MKKNRKIILLILVVILFVGVFFLARYLKSVKTYKENLEAMVILDVDIDSIADGVYIGDCDVEFIYAKVEVEVKDGKFISVNLLEHINDRGSSAEQIVDVILAEQKIPVDAISGATNSSNVIQKAIENALADDSSIKNQSKP